MGGIIIIQLVAGGGDKMINFKGSVTCIPKNNVRADTRVGLVVRIRNGNIGA